MNKHLFELLRRIEDAAHRLASTIMQNNDKRLRDIALVEVEISNISAGATPAGLPILQRIQGNRNTGVV
jgi:hypothetical protein